VVPIGAYYMTKTDMPCPAAQGCQHAHPRAWRSASSRQLPNGEFIEEEAARSPRRSAARSSSPSTSSSRCRRQKRRTRTACPASGRPAVPWATPASSRTGPSPRPSPFPGGQRFTRARGGRRPRRGSRGGEHAAIGLARGAVARARPSAIRKAPRCHQAPGRSSLASLISAEADRETRPSRSWREYARKRDVRLASRSRRPPC